VWAWHVPEQRKVLGGSTVVEIGLMEIFTMFYDVLCDLMGIEWIIHLSEYTSASSTVYSAAPLGIRAPWLENPPAVR
jgi:hypothetical protein